MIGAIVCVIKFEAMKRQPIYKYYRKFNQEIY